MQVLWEIGPSSVQSVQKSLKRELAYTTVQTMLTVLHRKKKVKRVLKDKAHIYKPTVTRDKFTGHAVREFIDRLFGGSAEGLVVSLIQDKHLSPERLAKLHEMLDKEETDAKRN
jgi:predicted transcriptional regulator